MYINAALFDDNQNFYRMEKIVLAFLWFITCLEREKKNFGCQVKYHNTQLFSIQHFYNFTDKCGLALSSSVELMLVALCVYRQIDFLRTHLCSSLIWEL